jgi:hypothetical protein
MANVKDQRIHEVLITYAPYDITITMDGYDFATFQFDIEKYVDVKSTGGMAYVGLTGGTGVLANRHCLEAFKLERITKVRTVWTWGSNQYGQLGFPGFGKVPSCKRCPDVSPRLQSTLAMASLSDAIVASGQVRGIAAGGDTSMLFTSDSDGGPQVGGVAAGAESSMLFASGLNDASQLGLESDCPPTGPNQCPMDGQRIPDSKLLNALYNPTDPKDSGDEFCGRKCLRLFRQNRFFKYLRVKIQQIALGAKHGVALVVNPKEAANSNEELLASVGLGLEDWKPGELMLFGWGDNEFGQAGVGANLSKASEMIRSPLPVRLPKPDTQRVIKLSCGELHCLVLTELGPKRVYSASVDLPGIP